VHALLLLLLLLLLHNCSSTAMLRDLTVSPTLPCALSSHSHNKHPTCCVAFTELRQRAEVKIVCQLAAMPCKQPRPDQLHPATDKQPEGHMPPSIATTSLHLQAGLNCLSLQKEGLLAVQRQKNT
jgi:hypothetical protein